MTVTIDFSAPALRAELGEIVQETLDNVDESTIEGAPIPEVSGHDGKIVESVLGIAGGGVQAALILRLPVAAAIALTAAMVDEPASEITVDEARGTVGELSNVIAGTAKTLVDAETELHVPEPTVLDAAEAVSLDMVVVHHRLGSFEAVLTDRH